MGQILHACARTTAAGGAGLVFALFLLAACDHQDTGNTITPATTTRTTSGTQLGAPVDSHAIDQVASARCDREQTCNNVGVEKSYATRDVCVQKLRADGG